MPTIPTGLTIDGTVVGQTCISIVDGANGQLSFRGYTLDDLVAHTTYEEVAHLLWYGDLPTRAQLDTLREHLATEHALTADELAIIRQLPRDTHGMDALRTAVSALAHLHNSHVTHSADALADGIRLTAKLPTILAAWICLRNGDEPIAAADPTLSHAARFLTLVHGRAPDAVATHAMNTYMVTLAENGLNVATFVARVVMTTQNNISSAITAAIATLRGVAHGGANEYAMRTFLAIGHPDHAQDYLADMVARKERLMGVGHRVYAREDPRMQHLRHASAQLAERPNTDGTSHAIATRVEALLQELPYFQQRGLFANVEFYSATLLHQVGIPVDCFTAVMACARMPGWIAHICEQLADNRLVRPEAVYAGVPLRPVIPIDERRIGV